jgi:hypothetical protein
LINGSGANIPHGRIDIIFTHFFGLTATFYNFATICNIKHFSMKLKYFSLLILIALVFTKPQLNAQENGRSRSAFFENLAKPDSVSGALVIIHQDKRIEELLFQKKTNKVSVATSVNGYRVQVFSSNVQRTAKNEAFRIEKSIRELFPEQGVYVNYTSPFWKVRVGDFTTLDQAQAFRNELIKVFPQYRSETYPVRDKINIQR